MGGRDAHELADRVARRSYGKLVAFLAKRTRDVAAAEDALADAFASALADWPVKGVPENPEAWLMTVARRKITDAGRRRATGVAAKADLMILTEGTEAAADGADIPDERLGLMFACAHPAIDAGVRAPLILQAVLGLTAEDIASAFLTSPSAMGKRLVRAKDKIRQAGIPFAVPERGDLPERLEAVLDAIYAGFGAGWTDAAGTDVALRALTGEVLYLAELLTELLPDAPEALGLHALMLHAEARRAARRSEDGAYVPLAEQDWELWDWTMIASAEAKLRRASSLGAIGRYQLEAAIQSAHVHRQRFGHETAHDLVTLYDALFAITGSPVVAINRALAVADARGTEAGLEALPQTDTDPRLVEYQPYWAAKAELLSRAGDRDGAVEAYAMAGALEADPAVRAFLAKRGAVA
jgi:RNA polymerase sigma-70 factor (ECF subfamily)